MLWATHLPYAILGSRAEAANIALEQERMSPEQQEIAHNAFVEFHVPIN